MRQAGRGRGARGVAGSLLSGGDSGPDRLARTAGAGAGDRSGLRRQVAASASCTVDTVQYCEAREQPAAVADLPDLASGDGFTLGSDVLTVTHAERDALGVAWRVFCRREP